MWWLLSSLVAGTPANQTSLRPDCCPVHAEEETGSVAVSQEPGSSKWNGVCSCHSIYTFYCIDQAMRYKSTHPNV